MPDLASIRILIVEDEPAKLSTVLKLVTSAAGEAAQIDVVRDAQSARVYLSENAIELLVLDLMLPPSLTTGPIHDGGVLLLEEIIERDDIYKMPAHVVGLTAYEEAFEAAQYSFNLESWSLIQYDPTTSEWRDRLTRKIKQIRMSKAASEGCMPEHKSFACVLTALDSELRAVLELPWDWTSSEPDDDVCVYHTAHIPHADGPRTIVAAASIRVGMARAASLAMKMIQRFRPRYIAMVGITAGIRDECNIGDIILADPSWHWESGKHSMVGDQPSFSPAPNQIYVPRKLRNRFEQLGKDESFLAAIRRDFDGDKPKQKPRLLIGPMASGSAVLNNRSFLDLIKAQDRKALAVEMEAYGVYTAAEESDLPVAQAFCIKGVSDFADGTKEDRYQAYAAYTSARAFQRLMEDLL